MAEHPVTFKTYAVRAGSAKADAVFDYLEGKEGEHVAEYNMAADEGDPADLLIGRAWARLGEDFGMDLSQGLTREQFKHLFHGRAPDGSETLTPPMRGCHAPGTDANLSPDKTVSLAFINATDSERALITAAHDKAVRSALAYLEDYARVARIKRGGLKFEEPAELLIKITTHHTSRPSAESEHRGSPADPQLHTHAWIFNVCHADGKWRTVWQQGMTQATRSTEAIYKIVLHEELRRMGLKLDIHTDRNGRRHVRLADMSRKFVHAFSTRSREVRKRIREFELTYGRSPRAGAEDADLARKDRKAKHDCGRPKWSDYHRFMSKAGIRRHELKYDTNKARNPAKLKDEALADILGANGIHRQDRSLFRWQIAEIVLNACIGRMGREEALQLQSEFMASEELVLVTQGNKGPDYDTMTTQTLLDLERRATEIASAKSRTATNKPSTLDVAMALKALGFTLDAEQMAAFELFTSDTGFATIEGEAGTGKGSILEAAANAYRRRLADKIISVSTAGATAERTGARINADISGSVESLLFKIASGDLVVTDRTVVFIDESVMLDSFRFAQLMEAIQAGIIRMVGDPHQLQAIGAGGLHVDIADRTSVARLTKVHRQKHEWYVDACRAIRAGGGERALDVIEDHDGLHILQTQAEAIDALVVRWGELAKEDAPDDIVVNTDQPNVVIDTLNRRIQDVRKRRGELGAGIELHCQRTDRTESISQGDCIAFTAGTKTEEGYVRNGNRGVVQHVDADRGLVRVKVGSKVHTVMVDVYAEEQPIRLAYAGHATRVQGAEGKTVLVLPKADSDGVAGYSMVTRGSHSVHVFASHELHGEHPKETLGKSWSVFDPKRTASREMEVIEQLRQEMQDPQSDHDYIDEQYLAHLNRVHADIERRVHKHARHRRDERDTDFGLTFR